MNDVQNDQPKPEGANPGNGSIRKRSGPDLSRFNTAFKLALIFFLTLAFLIPLLMLSGITKGRQDRQREAIRETSRAWAGDLQLGAPVVIVPVDYRYTDSKDMPAIGSRRVVIYPEEVKIEATLDPELRKRGIFTIPLYNMAATISGSFKKPALEEMGADLVRAHWDQSFVVFTLGDFRSLSQSPSIRWNDRTLPLGSPRSDMSLSGPALTAGLSNVAWGENASFTMDLALKGSDSFTVQPLATSTAVHVKSSWQRPSFFGSALPDSRTIGPEGMDALWKVTKFGLGHSATAIMQNGLINTRSLGPAADIGDIGSVGGNAFGFCLYPENSIYKMTDRSLKYGILFIIIPFAALFLIESLRRTMVHPVQYLLIGLANCLFFLLLLAISEQASFNLAFLIAAVVVISLCSVYSGWVLPRRRDGWLMAGLLSLLYGYMFTALQSEDYALLIGSVGLVLILGAIMVATRKIDWYRLGKV